MEVRTSLCCPEEGVIFLLLHDDFKTEEVSDPGPGQVIAAFCLLFINKSICYHRTKLFLQYIIIINKNWLF